MAKTNIKYLFGQIIKFGIVGFIAFFIDLGIYTLCTQVFNFHYEIAGTLGFTISVIFNYLASMKYVFKHKEDMNRGKEFVIFVVLSIIGLGINNLMLWVLIDVIPYPIALSKPVLEIGAKIIATGVVMIWNFVTRKIFLDAS